MKKNPKRALLDKVEEAIVIIANRLFFCGIIEATPKMEELSKQKLK